MKLNRWLAVPAAVGAAFVIGIVAVQAAPSASPSAGTNKTYAQVFLDKLAGILHLTPAQTQDALKQAQLQTVDQMLADGKITKAQADAMKARINAGQGLGPIGGFGFRRGGLAGNGTVMRDLATAELNAVASALHMSTADLQTALRSGKTLSALETQQKVSDTAVKAAMKAAAKAVLDKAVKAGTITQAEADSTLARAGSGRLGGLGRGFKQGESEQNEAPQAPNTAPTAPKATPNSTPTPTPHSTSAAYYSTI
jgi:3-hydroxyacyl-CoA dehydrogenase